MQNNLGEGKCKITCKSACHKVQCGLGQHVRLAVLLCCRDMHRGGLSFGEVGMGSTKVTKSLHWYVTYDTTIQTLERDI